jgi:superfamily II DNA/RNA helicase
VRPDRVQVLASTRELALQIHESFRSYGAFAAVRSAVVYGGVGMQPQIRALRDGSDIVVATPGRLLDLMQQGCASMDSLQVLVLDEADRMLDMGFLSAGIAADSEAASDAAVFGHDAAGDTGAGSDDFAGSCEHFD